MPASLLPVLVLLLALFMPVGAGARIITNNVTVSSDVGVGTSAVSVFAVIPSPSKVEFLQYAPGVPGATSVTVAPAAYSQDGTPTGTFVSTGPITAWDATPIALPGTVDLLPATTYHGGEPIFIRLTDLDQNRNPLVAETVLVYLSSLDTGDSVWLRLTETGPDTGVFVGAVQSTSTAAVANDRLISVGIDEHLVVSYTDAGDPGDTCDDRIMVDPYGLVFRTNDGAPVNGAKVSLVVAATGAEAAVYHDDGTPGYPATVTSGDPAYGWTDGQYRFPFVGPGDYILKVVPPVGYGAPSTLPLAVIQALPGNPFALETNTENNRGASFGDPFRINPGPALHIDLPLDYQGGSLFISKRAMKEVVAVGEFVPYSITVTNGVGGDLTGVSVDDRLPAGFRYQAGSATFAGARLVEPLVSADGRTLTFSLGNLPAGAVRELRYVTGVTVGAGAGLAINVANAAAVGNVRSNSAQARVKVIDDLFSTRSLVVGRVLLGNCPAGDKIGLDSPSLERVKLFMEDGRYAETDQKGLYHFEGLESGSHVVQVDLDSLPDGLEIARCEENSRFAGVSHSRFVDLQPGTMWRADFYVRSKNPEAKPQVEPELLIEKSTAAAATQPDGILSIKEGQRLADRIRSISVRFDTRLKPELMVDGKLIDNDRIGMQINEEESGRSVLGYLGVDLGAPGSHSLSFRGIDPFGNARFKQAINYVCTSEIAAIRVLDVTGNIADGKSPVRVKLELRDQGGEVINGESMLTLKGGTLSPLPKNGEKPAQNPPELRGIRELRESATVPVDSQGYVNFAPVNASGSHTATLAYGEVSVEVRTYVKPLYREWIMVGLAEGAAGYNTISGNLENLAAADQEDGYYQDGRLAFYAKGKIKGKYLLTAAYDSARERKDPDNTLFGAIDPNKYYTLYGDKSVVGYDAASKDKLYLKLDGEQFFALYGDYDTGLTVTELSRYSRTLTGFKGEFYGDKITATGFAAETDHAFLRDELPGDGTSGLYRLSHGEIVLNSEKITIETRDRFHSEVVLSRRQLSRFLDYTFDAQDGVIYFREPIFSRDSDFNPVYIVAEYEAASGAARDVTGGGRVAYTVGENGPEVGVSLIHEGTPGARADLQGIDLKYALDDKTAIKAEAATTSKTVGAQDFSGNAFLAEISHQAVQLAAKAYFRQQDGEFGLGQQAGSENATRKYGADGRYSLTKQADLSGEIFRQETLGTAALRDAAAAMLTYKWDKLTGSGGLRWARDEDGAGARTSTLLTGSVKRSFLADRLELYVNGELAVARDESSDYPNRLILGGEYAMSGATRIFAAHEMTFGENQDSQTSRVGFKATPWADAAFHSSLEEQTSEAGARTFASSGLTQGWKLSEALRLDFGLERTETLRHPGNTPQNVNVPPASGAITDDFTAFSTGVTYKQKLWSMTGRGEYRDGEQEDKVGLLWGFYREESPGFGLSSVFRYFDTDRVSGDSKTTSELEFSVARRPLDSRWIILDKAKFSEQQDRTATLSTRTRKLVNNLNANYLHDRRNQVSINHGIKYVIDNFDGAEYDGITQFLAVEYRHDLNEEWDLGLQSAARVTSVGDNALYSSGVSVGHSFARNIWLSVGYNFSGFRDSDFSGADYTAQGVYVKCRAKFDQNTARQLLAWWEK